MYFTTYEKQFIKAYNKTDLYKIAPDSLVLVLVDTYKHWKRGITVKQLIQVLEAQMTKSGASAASIELALNEAQPKGKRNDT